jgi:hypothetical protein
MHYALQFRSLTTKKKGRPCHAWMDTLSFVTGIGGGVALLASVTGSSPSLSQRGQATSDLTFGEYLAVTGVGNYDNIVRASIFILFFGII